MEKSHRKKSHNIQDQRECSLIGTDNQCINEEQSKFHFKSNQ